MSKHIAVYGLRDNKNMKTIIFMGRSGAGKTTLTQTLQSNPITYEKTQAIAYYSGVIDTPGEYAENMHLGAALALYAYEADVVGLLISATDDYSLFPPNIVSMVNREVIGIVTHMDKEGATPERAERWLRLSGCPRIFFINSKDPQSVEPLLRYLQT